MLRKEATRSRTEPVDDPTEQVLLGILCRSASESRAAAALQALRNATVDLNELRVTPVSEIVEILGSDYPQNRTVAEALSRTLNAVFNRQHDVALANLKTMGVKAAGAFLNNLDGVDAHARAFVLMRVFKAHVFPVDDNMLSYLRRSEYVAPDATLEDVQLFLERQVKAHDTDMLYHAFKRYAATHTGRPPRNAKSNGDGATRTKAGSSSHGSARKSRPASTTKRPASRPTRSGRVASSRRR
jgi:endonuclease III